jgi:hypothetical protein
LSGTISKKRIEQREDRHQYRNLGAKLDGNPDRFFARHSPVAVPSSGSETTSYGIPSEYETRNHGQPFYLRNRRVGEPSDLMPKLGGTTTPHLLANSLCFRL